jgi:hypothetical protein
MRIQRASGVAGLCAAVLGCLGALAHCGGGGSGSPEPNDDSGPGTQDATMPDVQVAPDGPDTTPPNDGSSATPDAGDSSVNAPDAGDGAANQPDAADAGGGTVDGAMEAGLDAGLDATPPGPPCDAQAACNSDASTVMCCGGYCIDTSKDPANCGQCGNACTAQQFCTGTACDDAIIANVCANAKGTVALDPYDTDNDAGVAIGAALAASCVPATTIVDVSQFATGVTEVGSGRPITGPGNTFITGGGGYGQTGVQYMEQSLTALYLTGDGTTGQIRKRDGTAIVDVQGSTLTSQHDFFYVQLTVEPKSGTLCFSGVGMLSPGTLAAGYYVGSVMIPNRSTYTSSWYVYQWDDTNGDSVADNGDTFSLVMQGP